MVHNSNWVPETLTDANSNSKRPTKLLTPHVITWSTAVYTWCGPFSTMLLLSLILGVFLNKGNSACPYALQEAHQTLEDLQASLKQVSDMMKSTAQYFCQDSSKFKLEELLGEILTFVKDFTSAKKVCTHQYVGPSQLLYHYLNNQYRMAIGKS